MESCRAIASEFLIYNFMHCSDLYESTFKVLIINTNLVVCKVITFINIKSSLISKLLLMQLF